MALMLHTPHTHTQKLACIMEVQGLPPRAMVEQASRRKMFFESSGAPRIVPNSRGKKRRPGSKDLATGLTPIYARTHTHTHTQPHTLNPKPWHWSYSHPRARVHTQPYTLKLTHKA
jgi:hypothetical protein